MPPTGLLESFSKGLWSLRRGIPPSAKEKVHCSRIRLGREIVSEPLTTIQYNRKHRIKIRTSSGIPADKGPREGLPTLKSSNPTYRSCWNQLSFQERHGNSLKRFCGYPRVYYRRHQIKENETGSATGLLQLRS